MLTQQFRVLTKSAAVEIAADLHHEVSVGVAARVHHLAQCRQSAWHHDGAGRSRREHQPAAARRILVGKLLRKGAAPTNTEYVDRAVDADMEQKMIREPCKARQPIRQ